MSREHDVNVDVEQFNHHAFYHDAENFCKCTVEEFQHSAEQGDLKLKRFGSIRAGGVPRLAPV